MRRLHLFEFGDQEWFPALFRDAETAYLATAYRLLRPLSRQWAEKISTALDAREPGQIVDLCSGSGGPMPLIIEELGKRGYDARAKLTDLHPNVHSATHPRISWMAQSLDATRVPEDLAGVRTMFSAFHHFRPYVARAILTDAFRRRAPICIFESGCGGLPGALLSVGTPGAVLLLMPFARPFRWGYLLFTYLIPLLPLIVFWDGVVSNLRIYTPAQMRKLTEDLQAPDYSWETGRIAMRGLPAGMPYLIGRPVPTPGP